MSEEPKPERFGPSTIPLGCLGARALGVTTDCRDAAVPPFLGTQYRDSEFHWEELSRTPSCLPQRSKTLNPQATGFWKRPSFESKRHENTLSRAGTWVQNRSHRDHAAHRSTTPSSTASSNGVYLTGLGLRVQRAGFLGMAIATSW